MRFKIGDIVKISNKFPSPKDVGRICMITEVMDTPSVFEYDVKEKISHWSCPVMESEIEPVVKVGEQLLLFEL